MAATDAKDVKDAKDAKDAIGSRPVWTRWLLVAGGFVLTGLVAFLIYWGSIHNEFVWDDPIVLGQQLQAFHSNTGFLGADFQKIFYPPQRIPQFGGLYYRPMILVSYMLDRSLWGDTPAGFHGPVIVLHALNSGLIFLLGLTLFTLSRGRTWWGAFLGALAGGFLFAAHPIHTESVCWMAGRSDTLATFFIVPALLCYLRWKQNRARWWWLAMAALLFFGGCLSKETAVGFLLIVIAADLLRIGEPRATRVDPRASTASGGGKKGSAKAPSRPGRGPQASSGKVPILSWVAGWAVLGASCLAYLALRNKALLLYDEKLTPQSASPLEQLSRVCEAIGFYVWKTLVPVHLDAYIPKIPIPGPSFVIGCAALIAAVWAVGFAWMRGSRLVAFLIAFFFAGLAPSLAIAYYQISEAPVAERYLYIPSIAFCLLLGYLGFVALPDVLERRASASQGKGGDATSGTPWGSRAAWSAIAACGVATLALGSVYAAMTIDRERAWKEDVAFWTDGVAKSPDEGLPHLHLGLAYANLGRSADAEREYKIAIDPAVDYDVEGRSTALNNLGMLYMGKDDFDQADGFFERAIRMRRNYATPYYGLGVTAMKRAEALGRSGQVSEATKSFDKSEAYFLGAIQLNPNYVKAHNQLGYLYAMTGRTDPALEHLNRVLQLVNHGQDYEFARSLVSQIQARKGQ